VQRALRMILLGSRNAERRHHRVADELLHRAAGALDLLCHRVVETLEQHARSLGILLAELRGADEVGEEDTCQLPLLAGRNRRDRLGVPPLGLRRQLCLRPCTRPHVERRILDQDRPLEIVDPAGRLDAELLDEHAPRVLVDLERLCLSARAVEREHQLAA
jgi:hypothetical protein